MYCGNTSKSLRTSKQIYNMMMSGVSPNISVDVDEANNTDQQMMALPSSTRGDDGIIEGNESIVH